MVTSPARSLHRAASRLRVVAIAGAALLVLATVAAMLAPFPDGAAVLPQLHADGLPRAWAAVIACAVAAPAAIGLAWVSRMLACVSRGEVFSPRAVAYFRRFALCMLLAALMKVLLPVAATVLLALQRHGDAVRVSFDVGDLLALFLMAVFYFVSSLLVEAARLDEDSRSIV